jgi:diguanylate cyclase (GGDEF)-like protein
MATTLRPHWVTDIPKDPNWVFTDVSRHFGSWVGAPLIAHGRLFGFLSLEKTQTGYYTAKHAARLEILAGHVAIALMNALTYGEMERASVTDFLTGAYNHRYFQQQLRRELDLADRIGYPVSLLMLDLDHFKTVNDTYGHLCGDRVLQVMASRLKLELRSTDHLARYGGEEYAVILPGTHLQAAREVGDRLRRAVTDHPFYIEGALDEDGRTHSYTIPLTVSIGAAAFPEHAQAPRELIAAADQALYRAKAAGRNCILMASL